MQCLSFILQWLSFTRSWFITPRLTELLTTSLACHRIWTSAQIKKQTWLQTFLRPSRTPSTLEHKTDQQKMMIVTNIIKLQRLPIEQIIATRQKPEWDDLEVYGRGRDMHPKSSICEIKHYETFNDRNNFEGAMDYLSNTETTLMFTPISATSNFTINIMSVSL